MHPAFSVLFFTVTSGLGYGLLFCLLFAQLFGAEYVTNEQTLTISVVSAVLFTLGLLSSTQHLANPKNAWRSFTRFRTSWLSREGVLAVLGYPLFTLTIYAHLNAYGFTPGLIVLSLLWIVVLVYCTAMIYASLKTIPQWHTVWVPVSFLVFALAGGLLIFGQLTMWQSSWMKPLAILVLATGLICKIAYYQFLGQPTTSSINTATSFSQAKVTLFDSGHSSQNFSQREFVYQVGPKTTALARKVSMILAFVLPIVLLLTMSDLWMGWVLIVSSYLGLLLERWLFFVEAKHVVRHYYDQ